MRNDQMEGRRPGRVVVALAGALAGVVLLTEIASAERGYTTWYGPGFHGKVMASGRVFDENDPTTTASNQFPFGTWLRVTNPTNGKIVYVQVRDRGGFAHALDLSKAAYFQLDPPNPWGFWVDYDVVAGPGEEPRAGTVQPSSRGPAPRPSGPILRPVVASEPKAGPAGAARPAPASEPKAASASAAKPAPSIAAKPPAAKPTPPTEHVVAAGETLRWIAERYDLPLGSLAAWNGLDNPNTIAIGQRLRLTAPTRVYVVKVGETLNGIAGALGVSRETILADNKIEDPNHLVVGQELVVPG